MKVMQIQNEIIVEHQREKIPLPQSRDTEDISVGKTSHTF